MSYTDPEQSLRNFNVLFFLLKVQQVRYTDVSSECDNSINDSPICHAHECAGVSRVDHQQGAYPHRAPPQGFPDATHILWPLPAAAESLHGCLAL